MASGQVIVSPIAPAGLEQGGVIFADNSAGFQGDRANFFYNKDEIQLKIGETNAVTDFAGIPVSVSKNITGATVADAPYVAINVNNLADGEGSTSDLLAANDIDDGTVDNGHYVDVGIGSSAFADPAWTWISANDAYLSVFNGNLSIGASRPTYIVKFFTGGTLSTDERMRITDVGVIMTASRIQGTKGANVTAANDLTLGTDGNLFTITGNTQINAITTANWQAGSEATLLFTGTPTVKHNTAGGAGTAVLLLAGSVDLVAANNTILKIIYDGTSWQEVSRKVA